MAINNNITLSVIVPVYKAESYVGACIESILNQTFSDFELILVNDGSPDNSLHICNDYARKDNRIIIIDQENGGVSKARSNGLENSHGSWITFVDSDDTIPRNAFEQLFSKVYIEDVDCVLGSWRRIDNGKKHIILLQERGLMTKDEYIESLLLGRAFTGPVGKIFRRSVISRNDLEVPSYITNNEDLLMNLRIAKKARKVYAYPQVIVYNYWNRENSASAKPMQIDKKDSLYDLLLAELPEHLHNLVYQYIVIVFFNKRTDLSKSKYYKDILTLKNSLHLINPTRWKISYYAHHRILDLFIISLFRRCSQIKKIITIVFNCI